MTCQQQCPSSRLWGISLLLIAPPSKEDCCPVSRTLCKSGCSLLEARDSTHTPVSELQTCVHVYTAGMHVILRLLNYCKILLPGLFVSLLFSPPSNRRCCPLQPVHWKHVVTCIQCHRQDEHWNTGGTPCLPCCSQCHGHCSSCSPLCCSESVSSDADQLGSTYCKIWHDLISLRIRHVSSEYRCNKKRISCG